jgi:F0F1-type ATP synthase assembly protein I
MGQPPPQQPSPVARFAFAGTSLALTVVLLVLLGAWLDRRWNSSPWGALIGGTIGIIGGLYNLVKEFANDASNSNSRH